MNVPSVPVSRMVFRKIQPATTRRMWVSVVLLWAIWASRAHEIMGLPVFVDESLHILRAQLVFEFEDATASFLPGKLLLYYYLGLFDPQNSGGAWLARQAVALFAPVGAALTFALAHLLFRRVSVGLWAMVLYGLTPFMVFFERMALSDTLMMVLGLGLALAALRLARRPCRDLALLSGVLFGAALLAKLTAVLLAAFPLIAFWLFSRQNWRESLRWLFMSGIAAGMIVLLPFLYVVYQEVFQVENKQEVVTTLLFVPEEKGRVEQIIDNLDVYQEAVTTLLGEPLLVLLIGLGGWQVVRYRGESFYLLSFTVLIWIFVVVISAAPSTRYLTPGIPPLLILAAGGIDSLARGLFISPREFPLASSRAYGIVGFLAAAFLLIWGMSSVQFMVTAWDSPTDLALPARDIWEYYQNAPSGYALIDAAQDLPKLTPLDTSDGQEIRVAGFVAACHTLRLYLPVQPEIRLVCPYFRWNLEMVDQTLAEWTARLQEDGVWYFLADDEQPLDLRQLPAAWQEIAVYHRPYDGVTTRLFRVIYVAEKNS